MKKIAFQGINGAFSHVTAVHEFGEHNQFIGSESFREVFEKIHTGEADYAVVPIENSLVGSIYENYDLLFQYNMKIIGERFTRIEHCLLAVGNINLITTVYSHPKALEQCTDFFLKNPSMK